MGQGPRSLSAQTLQLRFPPHRGISPSLVQVGLLGLTTYFLAKYHVLATRFPNLQMEGILSSHQTFPRRK